MKKRGRVYAAASATWYWRQTSSGRTAWHAAAWGLGGVAVLATGIGLAVLYIDPLDRGRLGMVLVGAGLVLLAVAAFAWLRADTTPAPPETRRPPQRQHLDEALTVWVERRRRR